MNEQTKDQIVAEAVEAVHHPKSRYTGLSRLIADIDRKDALLRRLVDEMAFARQFLTTQRVEVHAITEYDIIIADARKELEATK